MAVFDYIWGCILARLSSSVTLEGDELLQGLLNSITSNTTNGIKTKPAKSSIK